MKPECAECEATLKLALEKAARLEKALEIALTWIVEEPTGWTAMEVCADLRAALRPEGT